MRKIKVVIELSEDDINKLEELTGTDICEDEDNDDIAYAIRTILDNL